MYGGRQFATYDQGWIGWFCLKALEMADPKVPPFTISGNGKQVRDVLHADDLIRVYLLAVKNIDRAAGEVYNIGGGVKNSLSLLELFIELERLTGNKMRFSSLKWRPGDQKVFIANIQKAQRDLDWYPLVKKEDGIGRMLKWTQEVIASGCS
jgi:CDP-paratose 2-epimerase